MISLVSVSRAFYNATGPSGRSAQIHVAHTNSCDKFSTMPPAPDHATSKPKPCHSQIRTSDRQTQFHSGRTDTISMDLYFPNLGRGHAPVAWTQPDMAESELVLAGLLFTAVLGTQRLDVARDHLLARNDLVLGLGSVFGGVLVDEVVVVVQQLELGLGDIIGGVEILANGSLVLFDKGRHAVAAFVALGERRRCTGDRGLGFNADSKNECKETDVDNLHRDVI